MSPDDLLNALIVRTKEVFKDFPLKTLENQNNPLSGGWKVHKQYPPRVSTDAYDYSEEDPEKNMFPYVIVKLDIGEKEENQAPQDVRVLFIFATKNEDKDRAGFDDVLWAEQAMQSNLDKTPNVNGQYLLQYPLKFAPNGEDRHPYYYMVLETNWRMHTHFELGGQGNGY